METTTIQATEWLTRYGVAFTGKVHDADEAKGTAKHTYQSKCGRCGGQGGSEAWKHTGWTCFECGGGGIGPVRTETLYTAAKLAKLNETQAKRQAKAADKAKAAEAERTALVRAAFVAFREANLATVTELDQYAFQIEEAGIGVQRDHFLLDLQDKMHRYGTLSPKQLEAARTALDRLKARATAKAGSQFVGHVGDRIEFAGATIERVIDLAAGYSREELRALPYRPGYIFLMRDQAGNRIVYKGSTDALGTKGDVVTFKATVEAHDDYQGENQTRVSRPKLLGTLDPETGKLMIWDGPTGAMKEVVR